MPAGDDGRPLAVLGRGGGDEAPARKIRRLIRVACVRTRARRIVCFETETLRDDQRASGGSSAASLRFGRTTARSGAPHRYPSVVETVQGAWVRCGPWKARVPYPPGSPAVAGGRTGRFARRQRSPRKRTRSDGLTHQARRPLLRTGSCAEGAASFQMRDSLARSNRVLGTMTVVHFTDRGLFCRLSHHGDGRPREGRLGIETKPGRNAPNRDEDRFDGRRFVARAKSLESGSRASSEEMKLSQAREVVRRRPLTRGDDELPNRPVARSLRVGARKLSRPGERACQTW